MPQLIKAGINISDVRDVAKIHVLALENERVAGKRFVVDSEKAYTFIELAEILKSNSYNKVSTKSAPNWLVKLMANFNSEMKGMLPYIGNVYQADVSKTMQTFNWNPMPLDKLMLETAKSIERIWAT